MDGRKEEVREEIENELSEMNEEKKERDEKVEVDKRGKRAVGVVWVAGWCLVKKQVTHDCVAA